MAKTRKKQSQTIFQERRDYNAWVANETLEDYALRFAPRSFRKWSAFSVANTAFGSIAFLMLEAIGGFLTVKYGFTNASLAILAAGVVIFFTSFPISYYAARYNVDMDLLTRGAGFGYLGSTLTSLIYAAFAFTLFALEASIMSLALRLYCNIPLAWAHVISAVVIIPLVTYGITNINRLQAWTQPVWLLLLFTPYVAILASEPKLLTDLIQFPGANKIRNEFNWIYFGTAMTVALAMVVQIGEQVDFLRFLPAKTKDNQWRWWTSIIIAGPGWIVFGVLRQLCGALLCYLVISHGVPPAKAYEPTQMYLTAYQYVFSDREWAITATVLLVVISQIKINVTNAYAGSLAWSNFFSRLTHCHPGRVVWLVLTVLIALLLMELGVFSALEQVLALFSNVAIAWIGALVANLVLIKPFGLGPHHIEFKRANLADLDPVGLGATLIAAMLSVMSYLGFFGELAQAFSALIALTVAFTLAPLIALIVEKKQLKFHRQEKYPPTHLDEHCSICRNPFEPEDKTYCPAYQCTICSLCCTLETRCLDVCRPTLSLSDQLGQIANLVLPAFMSPPFRLRLLKFLFLYLILSAVCGVIFGAIYYQDFQTLKSLPIEATQALQLNFFKVASAFLVLLGLAAWWMVLNTESRHAAQKESLHQTQLLLKEIDQHKLTDRKLQRAMKAADQANLAKSRFLSDLSHEIRTPLNSILGYAQILSKDPKVLAHRSDAVITILRSGEHLSSLIEDILDIARIEARKFNLKPGPFNFPALIEQLVSMFKPQAETKGLSFHCLIPGKLPQQVRGDEQRIRQILINLLGNAVKFTSQGKVLFRIDYSGEVARFEVIDTGSGIPYESLDAIFIPFKRLDNNQGNAIQGSGIGLTISKILVQIMGGDLNVESQPGRGSKFSVQLFLPELQAVNEASSQDETTALEKIIGYRGPKKKILVVDDQPAHRDILVSMLTPYGFLLTQANSGERCLEQVLEDDPDAIFLDMLMPGIGGLETVKRLRQRGYKKTVIMVSANAYPEEINKTMAEGADDFLTKPIDLGQVLSKIKRHLELDWTAMTDDTLSAMPSGESNAAYEHPPLEILNEMSACAQIGDLRGLSNHLENLMARNSRYRPFANRLSLMIREFRLNDIKQLLRQEL